MKTCLQSSSEKALFTFTDFSGDQSSVTAGNEVGFYLPLNEDRRYKSVIELYQAHKGTSPVPYDMIRDHLLIPDVSAPAEFLPHKAVVTKKRNRMLQGTVEMLVFFKYRETLSGSRGNSSSSNGGGESDELYEMDREMNGDSCDAARTKKRSPWNLA